MIKKGRNPENSPIMGTIKRESFSGIIVLVKKSKEIMITKIILGIKDDTVSPYNDEISNCFLLGLISSNVVFRTIIAAIKPIVKIQKRTCIVVFKRGEEIRVVIDCNQ